MVSHIIPNQEAIIAENAQLDSNCVQIFVPAIGKKLYLFQFWIVIFFIFFNSCSFLVINTEACPAIFTEMGTPLFFNECVLI